MNTQVGKTFGLALLVAVGILAVMFALGTFSAQKTSARPLLAGSLTITPSAEMAGDRLAATGNVMAESG